MVLQGLNVQLPPLATRLKIRPYKLLIPYISDHRPTFRSPLTPYGHSDGPRPSADRWRRGRPPEHRVQLIVVGRQRELGGPEGGGGGGAHLRTHVPPPSAATATAATCPGPHVVRRLRTRHSCDERATFRSLSARAPYLFLKSLHKLFFFFFYHLPHNSCAETIPVSWCCWLIIIIVRFFFYYCRPFGPV